MEEIGIESPSPTQQGSQTPPIQYTEELSSVAINIDNMLSDTENPQGMEMSTMQCVPHPELHLSDEREAEPTGIAPFPPLMNSLKNSLVACVPCRAISNTNLLTWMSCMFS